MRGYTRTEEQCGLSTMSPKLSTMLPKLVLRSFRGVLYVYIYQCRLSAMLTKLVRKWGVILGLYCTTAVRTINVFIEAWTWMRIYTVQQLIVVDYEPFCRTLCLMWELRCTTTVVWTINHFGDSCTPPTDHTDHRFPVQFMIWTCQARQTDPWSALSSSCCRMGTVQPAFSRTWFLGMNL